MFSLQENLSQLVRHTVLDVPLSCYLRIEHRKCKILSETLSSCTDCVHKLSVM